MKIIAGLGNPGKKYENTRHNLGFKTLDLLADDIGVEFSKEKFHSILAETRVGGEKVILMKPTTYMNESGTALREAADFYKVAPEDVVVCYDDFDIPVGTLRIRPFGSAGTHNGMRSVVKMLGTQKFPRVRIGTGSGDIKDKNIVDFVLQSFTPEEQEKADRAVEQAKDALKCFLTDGIDRAMNRYNTKKENNRSVDE